MQTYRFGQTDLMVTRVCFGTWELSGAWGAADHERGVAAIRKALELGVNFFDTAQAYNKGESERVLGEALREEIKAHRERVVLASKGGQRETEHGGERDGGAKWLRKGIEDTLRNLGTDHLDLYQVHWPDPATPLAETAGIMQGFVDEGLTRYVGVSNFTPDQMTAYRRGGRLDAVQPPYHMFRRDAEVRELPYAQEHGLAVLSYGTLGHGLLTGSMKPDTTFDAADWRASSDLFGGETFRSNLEVVDRLEKVAADLGATLPQLAVAWALRHPAISSVIVGSSSPEHVEGTVAGADLRVSGDDWARVRGALSGAAGVGGPSPEGGMAGSGLIAPGQ